MAAIRLVAIALAGLSVAACSTDSGPKEIGGTAAGAVAGGVIGNAVGGSVGNRVAGTLAGAALGAFLGNRIGAALDDEDKRRAYTAQMQALEAGPSGAPGRLAQSGFRTLRQCRAGPRLPGQRRSLPAVHAHGLH